MIAEILAADVTVVPMRRNPYSVLVHTNKMFEYLALGRPIVASRLDFVAAYFPDDAIKYFEPDDDADLARRLRETFTDREAAAKRVRTATAIYEGYRWTAERRKYLAVYDSIARRRGSCEPGGPGAAFGHKDDRPGGIVDCNSK